jgi:SNF2 family DNA or RNA helicase
MAAVLRPLWRWQEDALPEVLRRDELALFWEMRLGKTIMALRWLYADRLPALVVSPLTVCRGWCDEISADGVVEPTLLRGTDKQILLKLAFGPDLCVINYDLLWRRPHIANAPWKSIVLDESPLIRSPKAERTKHILRNYGHVPNKCLLSGYPAPQSSLDYFTQGQFLSESGTFMGSSNFWKWRSHVARQAGPYDWNVPPDNRIAIKQALNPHALWLTRKQAGMHVEKVREVRYVALHPRDKRAYREAVEEFVVCGKETKWTVVTHTAMRRLCGMKPKVAELVSLAIGELREEPLVVWAYFRDEIKRIVEALRDAGRKVTYVHGGTGSELRAERVRRFQEGEHDVFVGQMDCARYGLDLSRSDTVINFSRSWQPESNWQSEDRIVHGNKSGSAVLVLDLVTEDTLDENVRKVLFEKRTSARSFLARLRANVRKSVV